MQTKIIYEFKTVLLAALLSVTFSASGEESAVESVEANQVRSAVINAELEEQKQKLIQKLVGVNSVQNFAGTVENFLPNFQLATVLSEGDLSNTADQVALDLSFILQKAKSSDNDAKLKVLINRRSDISEDLAKTFDEATKAAFSDDVGSLDDISVSFFYNITSQRFGRAPGKHLNRFTKYVEALDGLPTIIKLRNELANISNGFDNAQAPGSEGPILGSSSAIENDLISVRTKLTAELDRQLTLNGLNQFYKLVSNQPQLNFGFEYKSRDPLVGADEFEGKLNYEMGFTNINSLNRHLKTLGACAESERGCSYQKYGSYMNSERVRRGLISNKRLSFSLAYSDISDHVFEHKHISFKKKGGGKLTAKLSYGRSLITLQDTEPTWRVDLALSVEEYVSDTEGNDRYIGNLSFTKKLANGLSLPISFQYANKSEFLSDDNNQVSGHFGLKYDFKSLFTQ